MGKSHGSLDSVFTEALSIQNSLIHPLERYIALVERYIERCAYAVCQAYRYVVAALVTEDCNGNRICAAVEAGNFIVALRICGGSNVARFYRYQGVFNALAAFCVPDITRYRCLSFCVHYPVRVPVVTEYAGPAGLGRIAFRISLKSVQESGVGKEVERAVRQEFGRVRERIAVFLVEKECAFGIEYEKPPALRGDKQPAVGGKHGSRLEIIVVMLPFERAVRINCIQVIRAVREIDSIIRADNGSEFRFLARFQSRILPLDRAAGIDRVQDAVPLDKVIAIVRSDSNRGVDTAVREGIQPLFVPIGGDGKYTPSISTRYHRTVPADSGSGI